MIQRRFSRGDKDYSFYSTAPLPKERASPVLTSSVHFPVSPLPSPTVQPRPSHIPGLHFIHPQIFTMGDPHHPAPCHCRRPGFPVCLLHSGASGASTGEAPPLWHQRVGWDQGGRGQVLGWSDLVVTCGFVLLVSQ